jgi:hypothetical protein
LLDKEVLFFGLALRAIEHRHRLREPVQHQESVRQAKQRPQAWSTCEGHIGRLAKGGHGLLGSTKPLLHFAR